MLKNDVVKHWNQIGCFSLSSWGGQSPTRISAVWWCHPEEDKARPGSRLFGGVILRSHFVATWGSKPMHPRDYHVTAFLIMTARVRDYHVVTLLIMTARVRSFVKGLRSKAQDDKRQGCEARLRMTPHFVLLSADLLRILAKNLTLSFWTPTSRVSTLKNWDPSLKDCEARLRMTRGQGNEAWLRMTPHFVLLSADL